MSSVTMLCWQAPCHVPLRCDNLHLALSPHCHMGKLSLLFLWSLQSSVQPQSLKVVVLSFCVSMYVHSSYGPGMQ